MQRTTSTDQRISTERFYEKNTKSFRTQIHFDIKLDQTAREQWLSYEERFQMVDRLN